MKVGDIVKLDGPLVFRTNKGRSVGIIINFEYDRAEPDQDHKIFNVFWDNGDLVWEHETYLKVINESR